MASSRFPQALPYLTCGVALSAALLGLGVRVAFGQTPRAALTAPNVRGVRPAFLLFSTKSSSVEREFAASLPLSGGKVVAVRNLDGPEAREFRIDETPTLV